MMTLKEIKQRCGEEHDVVPPQVTLHLCLKIEELQSQIYELKSCLNLAVSWAENWDAEYMEDAEWIEQDHPRIKAAIKGEK